MEAFIEKAKRYTDIPELTPELLLLLIERIEIGELSVKYSHSARQSICIVYRDIGVIDYTKEQEAEEQQTDERQGVELQATDQAVEKTA